MHERLSVKLSKITELGSERELELSACPIYFYCGHRQQLWKWNMQVDTPVQWGCLEWQTWLHPFPATYSKTWEWLLSNITTIILHLSNELY